ncbi:MAG: ATP-binding cassette domain-containing protein [Candidatus Lokiarchaeota archaeon]|nr:ATP-binding cassette domain-containing protein [Candidatus Lokiarchaeota archaeon]MBD3201253.1 ATP-binding cassette domain-containing protein [Candidatus Lokiarchaeota archaeon]
MIEAIDVNKEYRRAGAIIRALADVNLTIKSGEFVIIQGPTGCGKSTLLNVLSGLDYPDSGKIIFDGENIARSTEDRLARLRRMKIGFIFQDFNLINTLTALENVESVLWPTVLRSSEIENRAIAALRDANLLERKDHYPVQMSGGEKQKCGLARAIIHRPRVILADEPTGNLDPQSEKEVMDLLKKINKDSETTVIVVTHRAKLSSYGDKAVHMKNGEIESVK